MASDKIHLRRHTRARDAWFAALVNDGDALLNETVDGVAWWLHLGIAEGDDGEPSSPQKTGSPPATPAGQRSLQQRMSKFGV